MIEPATGNTQPHSTGLAARLAALAADIKLAHSVFALPFALLATFLAARSPSDVEIWMKTSTGPRQPIEYTQGGWPGIVPLTLIVFCMVAARTFAMLANRYVDREIDARNPRTADRAIPAGRLRPVDAIVGLLFTGGLLIAGAAMFGLLYHNWWPIIFCPLVLLWLGAYGLMKRFTLLCHFFLGAALGISPLAAALAINPSYLAEPPLWWLAGFVLLWVGGFDVIYALADIESDRREGLHSIPAALGVTGSLIVARIVHIGGLICLTQFWQTARPPLGHLFFAGVCVVGVLLIVEHRAASAGRFNMAFFTLNGVISTLLGAVGIIDIYV